MGWRPCRTIRPTRALAWVAAACVVLVSWAELDALVISEVMYHPPEADPDQRRYEFIELYNENADPQDLSGYSICNGVSYTFPLGTYLDGHTFVVVCADKAALLAKYPAVDSAIVFGDWGGSLDNAGERIEVCNTGGRTVTEVRYNDRGKWSSGADGTGHSLSLLSPYMDVDDPDSWTLSGSLGGTPGAANTFTFETGTPSQAPSHGVNGSGFILWWLALGPYNGATCGSFATEIVKDWLQEAAGGVVETDLVWHDGQVVNTSYGLARAESLHPNAGTALPTIKRYTSSSDLINLGDEVWPPNPDDVMSYSFVYVDNVTGSAIPVDVAMASDDAIVVLVNGIRVHANDVCRGVDPPEALPDRAAATLNPGKNLIAVKVFERGGGWGFLLRLERQGTGIPLVSPSQIQVTTDVDEGLGFDGSGTPILDPGEEPPEPPPTEEIASMPPVTINEGFFRTSGTRWVELYNRTSSDMDLEGYYVTDERSNLTKTQLGSTATIPAHGWASFTDTDLGLDFSVAAPGDRVFVALVDPSGDKVVDSYLFEPGVAELSEARLPDGVRGFYNGAKPTRGVANETDASTDIVINEVMYHPIDDDPEKEYIELYNRGNEPVTIGGWAFTQGVDFTFPPGTTVPDNGYLVIARNPQRIRSIYGLDATEVIGPETEEALDDFGVLRDRGERLTLSDDLGREVDSVRFYDGGSWPRWPDGGGSSMELIDPWQDNSVGQAWDASDDSAKAPVQHFSYTGRHDVGANDESEIHMILLERGITVVDNFEVIGGGIQRTDTPLIDVGESWRFFRGTEAPPVGWYELGFNDDGWEVGATGIGYSNDHPYQTVLDDMQGNYLTVFCRREFTIPSQEVLDEIDELVLSVIIDDGYYAYLNGSYVTSYQVTDTAWNATATGTSSNGDLVDRDISDHKGLLRVGTNVLAVQVHNTSYGSSDLTFIPQLVSRTTTVIPGGTNQVLNSYFDTDTNGWLIEGTHWRSGVTRTDPIEGSGSLKIVAAGRGDNKANRIETADLGLNVLDPTEDLALSFDARWVVGSPTIHTHGYKSTMPKTHELEVPEDLGTPGAPNSVSLRLAATTGEWNQGPVMSDVSQTPVVPGDSQDVVVTVRVQDADGVGPVSLYFSLNDASPSPQSVSLSPIGGDFYRGTVPGQPMGTKVVFFIAAADQGGRMGRYPADVRTSTHPLVLDPENPSIHEERYLIYRHDTLLPSTRYHSYRFWMTDRNYSILDARNRLSNDRVPGSFLYGSSDLYYEANTRFGGSPFARSKWGSYRAGLPRDKPLHGRIRKFGMDRHGTNAKERLSYYLMRNNQGAITLPYSETLTLVRWQVNHRGGQNLEHLWVPDAQFISMWFPGDDDGDFFEMDDRFVIGDGGSNDGSRNGRVQYPPYGNVGDGDPTNKENYRWFFGLRAKNGLDDYSNFIEFCRIMDPNATAGADFDEVIFDVCNVEELLRMHAVRLNTSDWDTWSARRGKNCYFYRPAIDGRWNLLAYDMELTYGNYQDYDLPADPNSSYNPSSFAEVNRFLNRPLIKRMYYSILDEMVNGTTRWFHSSRLTPYMQRLQALGMSSTGLGMPGGYIDDRAALLQDRIRTVVYPQTRLRITTNGGNDFATSARSVSLAGDAPVDATILVVVNNGDPGNVYPTSYDEESITGWSMTDIPVYSGANTLTVYGFDLRGNLVDSESIQVTSTAPPLDPPEITELNPAGSLEGNTIDVIGSGFLRGVRVIFGQTAVDPAMVVYDPDGPTPDRISVIVPPGAGTVGVKVRNPDGQESNVVSFTYEAPPAQFLRGDANGDLVLDVSDAVTVLLYLYGGLELDCHDAADADDDEDLTITDAMRVVQYLFQSGPPPEAPFPGFGFDEDGSALGCDR